MHGGAVGDQLFVRLSVIGELVPFKESYEVCSRAKWWHLISQKALLAAQKNPLKYLAPVNDLGVPSMQRFPCKGRFNVYFQRYLAIVVLPQLTIAQLHSRPTLCT